MYYTMHHVSMLTRGHIIILFTIKPWFVFRTRRVFFVRKRHSSARNSVRTYYGFHKLFFFLIFRGACQK